MWVQVYYYSFYRLGTHGYTSRKRMQAHSPLSNRLRSPLRRTRLCVRESFFACFKCILKRWTLHLWAMTHRLAVAPKVIAEKAKFPHVNEVMSMQSQKPHHNNTYFNLCNFLLILFIDRNSYELITSDGGLGQDINCTK